MKKKGRKKDDEEAAKGQKATFMYKQEKGEDAKHKKPKCEPSHDGKTDDKSMIQQGKSVGEPSGK